MPTSDCLILSRPALIDALHTVTVAAITSTRRGSPTEVDLDVEDGLIVGAAPGIRFADPIRRS